MGLSAALRISQAQRPETSGVHGPWLPSVVTQVAAGRFWLANADADLGQITFKIPEGNANTTFDLIQAVVANQPDKLTENGNTVWRFRDSAEANPARMAAVGTLQVGWTGATYIAGWFRLPDASGDITGTNVPFGHRTNTTNRRLITGTSSTGDVITWSVSGDGSAVSLTNFPTPFVGAKFHWLEWFFDPLNTLGGTTAFGPREIRG